MWNPAVQGMVVQGIQGRRSGKGPNAQQQQAAGAFPFAALGLQGGGLPNFAGIGPAAGTPGLSGISAAGLNRSGQDSFEFSQAGLPQFGGLQGGLDGSKALNAEDEASDSVQDKKSERREKGDKKPDGAQHPPGPPPGGGGELDPLIQELLKSLGLAPSGDRAKDIQAIEDAVQAMQDKGEEIPPDIADGVAQLEQAEAAQAQMAGLPKPGGKPGVEGLVAKAQQISKAGPAQNVPAQGLTQGQPQQIGGGRSALVHQGLGDPGAHARIGIQPRLNLTG